MSYALATSDNPSYQRKSLNSAVSEVIRAAVGERVFPGCVCTIAQGSELMLQQPYGFFSYAPLPENDSLQAVRPASVYDVDSLTFSIITNTLAMKAVEQQRFQLTDKVSRYVHGFGVFGKSSVRIVDLLRQESGLPLTEPFFQKIDALSQEVPFGTPIGRGVGQHLLTLIKRFQPRSFTVGQSHYSEIGTLLMGFLLEELWAKRIDQLAQQFLFKPLNISNSGFIDHGWVRQGKFQIDRTSVVPSEECPWRRRVLQGEVRDENTWAIGGISGEAGFFANSADITLLIQSLLAGYRGGAGRSVLPIVSTPVVREFFEVGGEEQSWALGWARTRTAFGVEPPSAFSRSLGAVSPSGCAVWFDPETSLSLVFLSNTTMPSRSNRKIGQFWPKLLKAVWSAIG
ncbi:MAG: serine hydrolase [Bdellovibrionales bacterium]|nr:serine hydrolase [Bdellovibrionales bacterium]